MRCSFFIWLFVRSWCSRIQEVTIKKTREEEEEVVLHAKVLDWIQILFSQVVLVFQERRREEERKRREEREARRLAAEAKAKEVDAFPLLTFVLASFQYFVFQEERRLRAEAREAERIKEEAERRKMEQERSELRARRLMEREGLLRRFLCSLCIFAGV